MSAINLRLWSQNHKWMNYCFFKRLVPAAGNYCPQRGQPSDNFSQSKPACPWFCLHWQLLKDISIHFLSLALAPVCTSGWNSPERKIPPNVFFLIIIIFTGLVWLSELVYSPLIQEAVLSHHKVQDHWLLCLCCLATSAESLVVAHKGWEGPKSLLCKIKTTWTPLKTS